MGIRNFLCLLRSVGIAMAVSSGDPAPLVGHNAFLRWSAIREVSWVDSKDGERKFWSEAHVSEDFDLALRLQVGRLVPVCCFVVSGGFGWLSAEQYRPVLFCFLACGVLHFFMRWMYGECRKKLSYRERPPYIRPATIDIPRYFRSTHVDSAAAFIHKPLSLDY